MPVPTAPLVVLTDVERETLERWKRRHTSAQALAFRCRIELACAEGGSNSKVAEKLEVNRSTVAKWRSRFVDRRLELQPRGSCARWHGARESSRSRTRRALRPRLPG